MTPRVSFVIPAYNAERWISKTIWSCRNQTIKQIEIIVVNDGSTDMTKDIIDSHAASDPRVIVFHVEKNIGRSAARNYGNSIARAPIILVLDADDMAARNRAKDTLAVFQLKAPDVLYGSFFVCDGEGKVERKAIAGPFLPEINKEHKLNFICHSTMAYTKKVAETIKYDEGEFSRLGLDDWKFQWDAHKAGFKILHTKNALSYYRVYDDQTVATRSEAEVAKTKEAFLATL